MVRAKANLFRNKRHFVITSLLSIPTICICVVILNYTNILTRPVAEDDFQISSWDDVYAKAEVIYDNIEQLKSVEGIEDISYRIYYNGFSVKIDDTKLYLPSFTTVDGTGYAHATVMVISNDEIEQYRKKSRGSIDDYNLENHVLISKNIKNLKYAEGDKIYAGNRAVTNVNPSLSTEEDMRELTIAGFIDTVAYGGSHMNIYVTEENFERITGRPPVPNIIYFNVKNGADIDAIRSEVNEIFYDESFEILDNIYRQEVGNQLFAGLTILVTFLCSALFVCIIILLWAFISYYIREQKTQIRILDMVGAYIKTIIQIFVLEAAAKALVNSVAGIASGTLISYFVMKTLYSGILVNVYAFIIYGLIFLITIAAHIIPSFASVNTIIEEGK